MTDDVIIAFLLSYPGIADMVVTRGYPYGRLPQNAGVITAEMPAFTVALWEIETTHSITAEKRRDEPRFYPVRTQIDIYGLTGRIVAILSQAIRDILDGYSGGMANHTVGAAWKRNVLNIEFNPETNLFHRMMDFRLDIMN